MALSITLKLHYPISSSSLIFPKFNSGNRELKVHYKNRGACIRCLIISSGKEAIEQQERRTFSLEERLTNSRIRRYIIDEKSGEMQQEVVMESSHGSPPSMLSSLGIIERIKAFYLPFGYPHTVSEEYLTYMSYQFPVHVTGWICSTLVTSTLLGAVGLGSSPTAAVASTAAIKWVTKDGIGAIGRFVIGGRFGNLFDEDPKQWRMYADLIGSFGGILEIATPLAPGSFLLLASTGNLTKAIAKGLKQPSWRVIQNHFSINENVGDIVAKEEVWSVTAQVLGLSLGVFILSTPEVSSSYWTLVSVWASFRLCHLYLRHQSLNKLNFKTINFKRASLLIRAHISGSSIPCVKECNIEEPILYPRCFLNPQIKIGCSIKEAFASATPFSPEKIKSILNLYEKEDYCLTIAINKLQGKVEAKVVLKEGVSSLSLLRAMWQAEWIQSHHQTRHIVHDNKKIDLTELKHKTFLHVMIRSSLTQVQSQFDSFLFQIREAGWDTDKIVLRPPSGAPFLAAEQKKEKRV